MLNVKCTTLQTRREKRQDMKKWSIVSSETQKTHFVHPVNYLLARLPFVKIIFLKRNHIIYEFQWYFYLLKIFF
jgi:hypothetical protein